MTETKPCPLCKTGCIINGEFHDNTDGIGYRLNCPICGLYEITNMAETILDDRKNNLYIISGVTRHYSEQYKGKKYFTITEELIENDAKFHTEFTNKVPKGVLGKAALLLQYIFLKSEYPGDTIMINPNHDFTVCCCKNFQELIFYINHLENSGVIEEKSATNDGYELCLTTKGWQEIDNLNKPNLESKQAFVAMWFDQQMDEPFENGILPLEKETETGFKMFRVDKAQFNDEKICDKIIAEIKRSRFLIADVTGHRQAVYFEAGYAMAMGLPVIWTCKNDNEHTDKCCFDTRQYPHVFWKDADDLKNRLKNKIMADIVKIKK